MLRFALLPVLSIVSLAGVSAGEVDVVDVSVRQVGEGVYQFDVTLNHADEGWEHYADQWQVLLPTGELLATRVLYHPHVHEQPFTRSLSGVAVPSGTETVIVRGRDSVHEFGGKAMEVQLSH